MKFGRAPTMKVITGTRHSLDSAAVRILLVDPAAYSLPYDDALAAALARRGHDVELVTSPAVFGEAPEPEGYRRNEAFLPLSGRLFRRAPRSRSRRALAAVEYPPGAAALLVR